VLQRRASRARLLTRLVSERNALVNQIRGLLSENGFTIELGVSKVRRALPSILEDAENDLSNGAGELLANLYRGLVELDDRIARYDHRIKRLHERDPVCQRISKIAGVGLMTATAVVAAVGDANNSKNGRQLAALVGLVSGHVASGGKSRLPGIGKSADRYLSYIADPWRPGRALSSPPQGRSTRLLDQPGAGPPRHQSSMHRAGQQECTNYLGAHGAW